MQRETQVWSLEQRALGYWVVLRAAGIQPDDRLCESGNLSTAGSYRAFQRLLATGRPFTAIFCANDESAVRVDKEAVGACAVQCLLARALAPDAVAATVALHVELIQLETVAASPRGSNG